MIKRRACGHDGNTGREDSERLPKFAGREGHVRGTGLGLAIARDIARSHGGDIICRIARSEGCG
jgi:signal transduction histidine kinase